MKQQQAIDFVSPKIAGGAAGVIGLTGLGAFFEYLTPIAGGITALLAAVLGGFMLWKVWLDIKIRKMRIKEGEAEAARRKAEHLPLRRHTDK